MSQTIEKVGQGTEPTSPLVAKQDLWVSSFTGVETRRGAPSTDPNAPKVAQPRDLKLAEVDGALTTLNKTADEIGPPLGRTAVEPDIQKATTGRDALANAAGGDIATQLAAAPALLQDIETTRVAAVKDKADGEAHAAKLLEVDTALQGLTEAANAIGGAIGRTAVETDIETARQGREALAKAATRDGVATQVAAAPVLLQGIETARLAAVKDKADGEAHATKLLEVDTALKGLTEAAEALGAPVGRDALAPDIEKAQQGREALAGAKGRDGVATQVAAAPALLQGIETARLAAVKDKADGEAHATKLLEVDTALKGLTDAANAIGAPLLLTAITPDIEKAQQGREALATATGRDGVATQVAAAPALLQGIETARLAAVKDKADGEALAAKVIEVNAALKTANEAAAAIGKPLERTAVDQAIKDAEGKRDLLANAATRDAIDTQVKAVPALLQEIETARLAAVKDKADCEDLATKLLAVNNALKTLTETADKITGPLARATVDPDILKATTARDDLAKAATREEIGKQVAAQPALLVDIENARKAAEQAEKDWQGLVTKKGAIEKTLSTAKIWIAWMPGGTAKTDRQKDGVKIDQSLKDLTSVTALKDYQDGLNNAESAINTLKSQAYTAGAPPYADGQLKGLGKWLPIFKPIADPNSVKTQFDALTLRKNNAGSSGNLNDNLLAVGNDAFAAANEAKKAYAADQIIVRSLTAAKASFSSVSAPSFKASLQTYVVDQDNKRIAAYAATTVAALASTLNGLKSGADKLRVAMAGVAPMTQAVQKSLTAADTAIKKLPTGVSPQTELTVKYTDLSQRLGNVGAMTDYWAQQGELDALDKAALALVEEARTAEFKAQAVTEQGRKEIATLIKSFGSSTDDPVKQAACRAAMVAIYQVPLEAPEGMSVKTLPAIFEMMTLIPKEHFKDLEKVEYETDPLINTSYYGKKKVVLNNIGDGTGGHELENQDDPSQTERVNYHNFTALHEFGHHVDEVNDVMSKNGSKAGFGQWKKETIDDVVGAVYTASFAALTGTGKTPTEEHLRALVKTLLETGAATKPASATAKLGSLFTDWANIEGKKGWAECLAIRDSEKSPWNTPVEIANSRCYHEGYEGDWYSYASSERTAGISNYQWRSPVEWFAEQYAFYRLAPTKAKPKAIATYLAM